MTIKEFALLAGVSVSTVSKIMNGKDASISARTREHPDADHGRDLSEY